MRCEAEPGQELHRVQCVLMMTDPHRITPGYLVPRRCGELPAACEESAAIIIGVTARRVVTRGVMVQKSAAAIVVFRCFTRLADHEG